ncbi:nicotinamide mononucleotide adenylyltransferase [[Candida] anglica]|uniref:Nicotinamide mononucleotide adenylyltransferase n=1 Tax=[Candida] anglica TaxID=148631 RepID=A0ABP0E8V7_9ASCO
MTTPIRTRMFTKTLQEFLVSNSDFKVIFNPTGRIEEPEKSFLNQDTQRICVLDSSFNPPHLGHLSLAKDSLAQSYSATEDEDKVLLLLLSVKNADKITPQPASFEERIDMMCLMANYLHKTLGINVSVGLTKHARFVDKWSSALSYIRNEKLQDPVKVKLTFSVGFDTLIRIFNPKYYVPDKISHTLGEFMSTTDLFCLTRTDADTTFQEQVRYVTDISLNKHDHIPSGWSSRIFLEQKNDSTSKVSSSSIRKQIHGQTEKNWENDVIEEIKDYIETNKIYR